MKGIILAGGSGSRLYPATCVISKQLLDVGGKPMIYYPLTQLMLAGIREVLLISTPENISLYENFLEDGSRWGIKIEYAVQVSPGGLAQAFLIPKYKNYTSSRDFIGDSAVTLILGDNIFYGPIDYLERISGFSDGALIFLKHVHDPQRFGVARFDHEGNVIGLIEKPKEFVSNYAVTGLYTYDRHVCEYAEKLRPSPRGELEITDLNRKYLDQGTLDSVKLRRGIAWFDTGTKSAIESVRQFILLIESGQSTLIGSPEEVALRKSFISVEDFKKLVDQMPKNEYSLLLRESLKDFIKNDID